MPSVSKVEMGIVTRICNAFVISLNVSSNTEISYKI